MSVKKLRTEIFLRRNLMDEYISEKEENLVQEDCSCETCNACDEHEYVLETTDLTKKYSRETALKDANFKIRKSDIYGLIGKNGAGKSTAIKLISGLISPTSGEVSLFGGMNLNEARKKIGVVIENPSFYPYMTVKQNIKTQCLVRGIKNTNINSTIDELLNLVNLEKARNKKAKKLSLGMKQRLGIALALVGEPEFLILDEPINGLDPMGIREIRELLLKLSTEAGITILISSHILGELSKMCTAYGIIKDGEVVSQLTTEELNQKIRPCTKLIVNNLDKALQILTEELGLSDITVENNIIRVFDQGDRSVEIVSALERADIILQSISREGADYETYFINLMQGGVEND